MSAKRRRRKINKKTWLILIISLVLAFVIYEYHDTITNLFEKKENQRKSYKDFKAELSQYTVFGIDVSQYQAEIDWKKLKEAQSIDFVFIRATAGKDHLDKKFKKNWASAKEKNIIRGAYHYYRPDENSTDQANFFIKNVKLEVGDFPPVLDIEKYSKVQSLISLKNGLLNWLDIVEEYYGVTPILYTYNKFYVSTIADDKRFDKYPVWIAWYNTKQNPQNVVKDWVFWQFTDKGQIEGIVGDVDVNAFNGKIQELDGLRIKN